MGVIDSKYLIIKAETLEAANLILLNLMKSMDEISHPEINFEYLTGIRNLGFANGKVIRNNTQLSDWGNGFYMYEFDCNIIAEYGDVIQAKVNTTADIYLTVNKCHCQECLCEPECQCAEFEKKEISNENGETEKVCACLGRCICEPTPCICTDLVFKYMPKVDLI